MVTSKAVNIRTPRRLGRMCQSRKGHRSPRRKSVPDRAVPGSNADAGACRPREERLLERPEPPGRKLAGLYSLPAEVEKWPWARSSQTRDRFRMHAMRAEFVCCWLEREKNTPL